MTSKNSKSIWMAGFAALFMVSMITISYSFTEASGELSEKSNIPRYSEICAHGHNGFDCKTPQHKVDISELQKRITSLEDRILVLES